MYLKRLLAFLCCFAFVFCLFPSSAFATGGNGNIDGGGGSMGHGTSSNFWNSGNDGVRITVVDASSGTAVSSPLDFSNRTQKTSLLHFGKVNKLQYLGGAGLSLQSGVAYSCIRPAQSMPTIVSSKGQSNIEAIKRYFCSEYACMMVAQAAGVDYERMIAGEYKLLIEPIAYFTHNGQYGDLFQEGCLWLCKAAFTYHAGQAQFSTYAKKVVKNGILSYCRKICSQGRHISRLIIGEQGELAADGEQIDQPDDHFDSHLSRLETLDLLEASKQNYQGVARLGIEALALKVQGMRITDIAALYQVPPSHVGAWISRSLEKLRNDPDFLTCLL